MYYVNVAKYQRVFSFPFRLQNEITVRQLFLIVENDLEHSFIGGKVSHLEGVRRGLDYIALWLM